MTKNRDNPRPSPDAPYFAIVSDPTSVGSVPENERQAEMRKALEAIIARLPQEQREGARRELEVGWVGRPIASKDPETARLWSRLLSLQAATEGERQPIRQGSIKVALVGSLDDPTFRALVVRRPDDAGVPLLLLPQETATGEDLLRGLQAASRSLGYTSQAGKQRTIAVRYGPKRQQQRLPVRMSFAKWDAALAHLRGSPQVDLEGYGKARVIVMASITRSRTR